MLFFRENDDDCKITLGSKNEEGLLNGNVHLQWSNGDTFKVKRFKYIKAFLTSLRFI